MTSKTQPAPPAARTRVRRRAGLRSNQGDPTRTKTIRNQYARQLRKRYRAISSAIQTVVVDRDFFDRTDRRPTVGGFSGNQSPPNTLPVPTVPMPRRPGYTYPDDPARIAAFERWLANATDAVILGGSGDRRWTDDYVRYAYGRGVVHGNHRLQNAGYQVPDIELADTFNSPLHRETLATFYQRQYTLLNGVNAAMQTEIARTLTEGMLAGQNPTEIARTLTGRVSNVGIYRANVIARTEIIHAYNEGALNRFERILGAEGELEVVVELATAGDSRVCDICRDLEGVIYTVKDAHNVIPVHPQCRCTWVPRSRAS